MKSMTKMISLVRTLCVTAIASLLAQSVWADVVTTWPESGTSSTVPNDTIVFRGITLEQLKNDYAIGAKMGGIADDHIGSAKWAAHVIAASSDTELKVQFQLLDGNFLKWTTVKFVQDTDGEETVIKATQLASTRAETSYQNDWSNYLVLKTAENGVGDKTAENYPLTWLKLIAHTYDSTEAAVSITDSDTLNIIRSSGDTYTFKGDNGVTLSFGSTTEAISSRLVFQGGATTTHEFTYSGNRGALFGRGATFDHPTILVDTNAKLKFNAHDLHGWESSSIVSDSVIRVNNGGVLTCNNPGGTSHYAGCLYLEPGSEMNIHGFGTDNFRIHGGVSDTVQQIYVPSPADGSEVTVAKITGTGVYMSKDGSIGFGMNVADGSTLEISAPINAHANTDKCKKLGAGELKITGTIGVNPWIVTAEGKTTIASGDRKVDGTHEVLTGAELSFITGDAIHYGGTSKIIASGTLNFNDKRQTFFSGNTMTLNPGANLIGAGDQHAAIDLCDETTITLGGGEGVVTIETPIRYRDANEFATYSTENEAGAKVLYKQLGKGSGGIAIGDNVEIEFVNIAFAHAIKGSGRATFTQKVPAAAGKAKFSSADDWTGDVMFKNIDNLNSSQGGQAFNFTTYGNASSTITCDGAAGWLESATVQSELKLVGNGFCVRDGSSGSNWCYIFNKISGSGPFKCDYGNDGVEVSGKNFQPIHIKDASEFTGAFWTDCSGIWITDSSTVGSSNGAEWAKKIIVDDGKTVTMGAEWTAPAGIYVNGNVTANCGNRKFKSNVEVGSTGTLTMSASDLINYDASSDQTIKIAGTLSCGNKRQSLGGHNKLIVVAGATISGAGDGEGAIDNFGGSKMTVEAATGDNAPTTVDWSAAVRYRSQPEFAIADGVTVNMSGAVMSESTYAKTVNKTGAGTLNLTGSVSAYITHKLSEGKITSNSATLNVTSGVDGKVVRKITADGVTTYDLAVAATITIPSVDHTTVAATVNGVTVDPSSGSLSVYVGDAVVVTYSAAEGYMMTDKVVNLDVTETTTITVPEGTTPQLIVATVNGTSYASLAAAKAACTGTETIVIVSDLTGQTYFARSSDYANVGAIEIATGVTVKGYFQETGATIPLVINGTFEITDGFTKTGNSATIPSLTGSGAITKTWTNTPVIYVENHAGIWTGTVDGCVHLSVAKSTDAYYYDANAIITALRAGTEVTNIGYTAETVPAGLAIEGDKLVLATYTVELKTFANTVCYAKIGTDGEEFTYVEAFSVEHGDSVYFHYEATEAYNITSSTTSFQFTNVHQNLSGGDYTVETAIKTFTITITPVANTTVTVNGEASTASLITVDYGADATIVYTADTNYKLVGTGSFSLTNVTADQTVGEGLSAELDVTTITIPEAPANTTVSVTVNGNPVTVENNTITVTIGASVVVTYTADEGYEPETTTTEFTAAAGTQPTINVPTNVKPIRPTAPVARVTTLEKEGLDSAYTFTMDANESEATSAYYSEWDADFVVTFDKAVAAGSLKLSGQYDGNGEEWADLTIGDVTAGTEIRLISMVAAQLGYEGLTVPYSMIRDSVKVFNCGVKNLDGNAGTKMTVKLVLSKDGETLVIGEPVVYTLVGTIVIPEESTITEGELVVPAPEGTEMIEIDGEVVESAKVPLDLTKVYTVTAKNANGEVIAESQIGVIKAKPEETSTAKTTVVAVPFEGATVANLLNTALLSDNDTLTAYVGGSYRIWTLTDGAWVGEQMVDKEGTHEGLPNTTALTRGTAVWVTTAGKIVVFGKYVDSTVAALPTSKETHLLANPKMTPYIPQVSNDDTKDQIVTIEATPVRYTKKVDNKGNVSWTAPVQVREFMGKPVYEDRDATPSIPVGTSFWFIKK